MTDWAAWLLLASVFDAAIDCGACASWNQAQDPVRIHGNTYYVGTKGLGAILIDSGDGLVLLDGGLPQSAPLIVNNIRKLGFDPHDIRVISISHAHFDHVGGVAALQRLSGASVIASPDAARSLRLGVLQENDPQFGGDMDGQTFPAVDNVLQRPDGTIVQIGDLALTLMHTPGHTAGGTSWTWQSCEDDDCRRIVYADSLTAVSGPGYRFSEGLGKQLDASIKRIAGLDCDILVSTHAFRDDSGCKRYAARAAASLERRLSEEQGDQ